MGAGLAALERHHLRALLRKHGLYYSPTAAAAVRVR
jgi:hypothetical protein